MPPPSHPPSVLPHLHLIPSLDIHIYKDAAALAAEETIFAAATKKGATKKVKGKDDFSMLDAALKSAPKTKAQKEAEAKKKAQEVRACYRRVAQTLCKK